MTMPLARGVLGIDEEDRDNDDTGASILRCAAPSAAAAL
jgi:hypothetical protein